MLRIHLFCVATAWALQIPRLTVEELALPGYESFARGARPFILVGAMDGWQVQSAVLPERLLKNYPEAIVDYYPYNLHDIGNKPYLQPISQVLPKLLRSSEPQYIHWRLHLDAHTDVMRLSQPLPEILRNPWMSDCLPDSAARNNLLQICAWNIVVVGNNGSGMFLHYDSLNTGTWQAQIVGTKEWVVCDPNETHLYYEPGVVDAFNPDLKRFPRFAEALEHHCAREKVREGEILFYPSNWWHQTLNHGVPCIGLVSRTVTPINYKAVAESVRDQCDNAGPDLSKQYVGAPPRPAPSLCGSMDQCLELWERTFAEEDEIRARAAEPVRAGAMEDFLRHPEPSCRVAPSDRLDCGLREPVPCAAAGCCWSPTWANCSSAGTLGWSSRCPWCFAPGAA